MELHNKKSQNYWKKTCWKVSIQSSTELKSERQPDWSGAVEIEAFEIKSGNPLRTKN